MVNATVIWQPKFSTNECLIATTKVREGKNYVFFAGDRNHPDLYSYDGSKTKKECKIVSNGKIFCYCVPMGWLQNEGELPEEFVKVREKEYAKFKKRMNK